MRKSLPEIDWIQRILWLTTKHEIYEVEGESMLPTLKQGELVLINYEAEPKQDDIVLVNHPLEEGAKMLKRIWKITPDNKYFLIGDNIFQSTDSRDFGELPQQDILGKAEAKLKRFSLFNAD